MVPVRLGPLLDSCEYILRSLKRVLCRLPRADGKEDEVYPMYFSRGAQRRVSVTRYALFISFLVVARFSFAQTVSYNGHTARVDEVLVRLKSTDAASLGRVKAALPSAAF